MLASRQLWCPVRLVYHRPSTSSFLQARCFSSSIAKRASQEQENLNRASQQTSASSINETSASQSPPPPRRNKSNQLPFLPLVAIFCLGTGSFYYLIKSREGQGYKPHQTLPASAKEDFQRR